MQSARDVNNKRIKYLQSSIADPTLRKQLITHSQDINQLLDILINKKIKTVSEFELTRRNIVMLNNTLFCKAFFANTSPKLKNAMIKKFILFTIRIDYLLSEHHIREYFLVLGRYIVLYSILLAYDSYFYWLSLTSPLMFIPLITSIAGSAVLLFYMLYHFLRYYKIEIALNLSKKYLYTDSSYNSRKNNTSFLHALSKICSLISNLCYNNGNNI